MAKKVQGYHDVRFHSVSRLIRRGIWRPNHRFRCQHRRRRRHTRYMWRAGVPQGYLS